MARFRGSEIFSIPLGDQYILYAPLKGLAFLVSRGLAALLGRAAEFGDDAVLTEGERAAVAPFVQAGLLQPIPRPASTGDEAPFAPTFATLFLTTECNLRCAYCYAWGGETPSASLSPAAARAAIEFIVENARVRNEKGVGMEIHGGGEPTLVPGLLRECVDHARRRAADAGLRLYLGLATNGVVAPETVDWIMDHFTSVTVSMDGPREIQDAQRPLAAGGGSFDAAMKTIGLLSAREFPFALRATVTDASVPSLERLVRFFCSSARPRAIHIEPVSRSGRCAGSALSPPTPDEFVEGFAAARSVARSHGIPVIYSGLRTESLARAFCGAAGESFCVTSDGKISSCYEVCSGHDRRAAVFCYGEYDFEGGIFRVSKEKLRYLRSRTVENLEFCADCFCKYHCAGDCLVKASDGEDLLQMADSTRCEINRALMLDHIVECLRSR